MTNLSTTHGDRFPELAATVLKRAKSLGATEADLLVAEGDSVSVQVRMSEVDRLSKAREKVLGIRVFLTSGQPVPRHRIFPKRHWIG